MMKANPRVLMALSRAFMQAVFLFDFVARHVGAEIILHVCVCVCVCPSLYVQDKRWLYFSVHVCADADILIPSNLNYMRRRGIFSCQITNCKSKALKERARRLIFGACTCRRGICTIGVR